MAIKEKITDKAHQIYLEKQCKKAQKDFEAYFLDEKNSKIVEITNKNGEKEKVEIFQLYSAHDIYLPDEMSALGTDSYTDRKVAGPLDAVAWMDKKTFVEMRQTGHNYTGDYQKPTIYSLREGEYPTIINSVLTSGIITGNTYIINSDFTGSIVNNNVVIKDSNIVCAKILDNAVIKNGSTIWQAIVKDNVVCDKTRVEFCNMYDNVEAENSTLTYSTFTENVKFNDSYIRPMDVAKKEWYGGDGIFNRVGKKLKPIVIDGPEVDPEEMADYGLKPYEFDGKKLYVSNDDMWFYYHLLYKDSGVEELKITHNEIYNSERTKNVLENLYLRAKEGKAIEKDLEDIQKIGQNSLADYKSMREELNDFNERERIRKDKFNKDMDKNEEESLKYFKENHPQDKFNDSDGKRLEKREASSLKVDYKDL